MSYAKKFLLMIFPIALIGFFVFPTRPNDFSFSLILTGISKGRFISQKSSNPPDAGRQMGGIAYISTLVNDIKNEIATNPRAFISLGGELSGSPEAYFSRGEFVIQALNQLHLDGVMVGNIEFTYGVQRLKELKSRANFPFFSSNVMDIGTYDSPEYIQKELRITPHRGFSVSILGLTPPNTEQMTLISNVTGLKFPPPGPELIKQISGLRQEGVSLIVLCSQFHRTSLSDTDWDAIKQAKPDVFILLDFDNGPSDPILKDGIWVKKFNGYNHGKEIDLLSLAIKDSPPRILAAKSKRFQVLCDKISPDQAVQAALKGPMEKNLKMQNEVIGEFTEALERAYETECPIGNLITDAMRDSVACDLALHNSGGIQSNISKGKLTLGDLYKVLPFDNELVTMDMYGADIQELLIQSASLKRGVLQISGGAYSFVNRGTNDFELTDVRVGNANLAPKKVYRVCTNSFLSEAGDSFSSFKRGKNIQFGRAQRDVVKEYIQKLCLSMPISVKTQERIRSR